MWRFHTTAEVLRSLINTLLVTDDSRCGIQSGQSDCGAIMAVEQ